MATRLYFPATEAAAVSPAFDGASKWSDTGQALRRKLANVKGSSAITAGTTISFTIAGLDRQYVSTRMDSGIAFTAFTDTVGIQLMTREFATTDNVDVLTILVKIVSEDGNTVRATFMNGAMNTTLEFINNATHRNAGG